MIKKIEVTHLEEKSKEKKNLMFNLVETKRITIREKNRKNTERVF